MVEKRTASIVERLDELKDNDDLVDASLACLLREALDWGRGATGVDLDERIAAQLLLPLVIGQTERMPPSRILERLEQVASRVDFHGSSGFWVRIGGIVSDLAAHVARDHLDEEWRERLLRCAPIADLGRRHLLLSVVGLADSSDLAELVDRVLRVAEQRNARRLSVLVTSAEPLNVPPLRLLDEECRARKIGLTWISSLRKDGD